MDSKLVITILIGFAVVTGGVIGVAVFMDGGNSGGDGYKDPSEVGVDVRLEVENTQDGADISWFSSSGSLDSWGYECGSEPNTLNEGHASTGSTYSVPDCSADDVVIIGEKDGERVRLD